MTADRAICIHGHFYQPPRENPWLEAIEAQDSAYPYHDWNKRITAECYRPNSVARTLDDDDRIVSIVNNYARISFNFGPTLLSWLQAHEPKTYAAILAADRESRGRFSGHGSALAQAYNHMIMPLANTRDRETQIVWGIADFRHRFGRDPEGMWLPETAVDAETLDLLAAHGICFTILAPRQATRTRKRRARTWHDTSAANVDPKQPYEVRLSSGRRICVFFYDGPVSQAVAFEGLLNRGEYLVDRLMGAFEEASDAPQLVHIATDGETYGHHHRNGEMALAFALDRIESQGLAQLTNYGEHLERHPPTHIAEVGEQTSWSCVHGVGRWWTDCGCSGGHSGWNQAWRTPLRNALDWLRDELAPRFEDQAGRLLLKPWGARNAYIDVVLDRSEESRQRFLSEHAIGRLGAEDQVRAFKLLEMQRHAMLAYTSCGWFFDDLAGIETSQVIRYAGACLHLAEELLGEPFEAGFLERLEKAKSNKQAAGTGRDIYRAAVDPSFVDLEKAAAHYAIASVWNGADDDTPLYAYRMQLGEHHAARAGKARLSIGTGRLSSTITGETDEFSFGVVHLGDHNVNAGVRRAVDLEDYAALITEADAAFGRGDLPEVIRVIDRHFGETSYTLSSLFRDEQRKILDQLLDATLRETAALFTQVYENQSPLMRFLGDLSVPLPSALKTTAEFVINSRLREAFSKDEPDPVTVRSELEAARHDGADLDEAGLSFAATESLARQLAMLRENPEDHGLLDSIVRNVELIQELPFSVELLDAQDTYFEVLRPRFPALTDSADWVTSYNLLGELLKFSPDEETSST